MFTSLKNSHRAANLKRVEAVIPLQKLEDVRKALRKVGVSGMTIIGARGNSETVEVWDKIKSKRKKYNSMQDRSKAIVITVAHDSRVDSIIESLREVAGTGSHMDGKIFITTVEEAIDIASGIRSSVDPKVNEYMY